MPKKVDMIGKKYGKLTVVEELPERRGKAIMYKCVCECGGERIARGSDIRSGRTQSCGCIKRDQLIKRNKEGIVDLVGQRFGKLVVLAYAGSKFNHAAWLCECDCGNQKIIDRTSLIYGGTISCGCSKQSIGEYHIEKILKENNFIFKKEYFFNDLLSENNIPLRFDFAVFNKDNKIQFLIEYDGEQHFSRKGDDIIWSDNFDKRKKRDKQKNTYCINHNIRLIRIPYWEKNNITLDLLLGDKYLIS